MSNKKRRNREKQSETISLGLTELKANQTTISKSVENSESNESKTGLFAYLKNPSNFWIVGLIALFALGTFGAGLKYLDDAAKQERASGSQNQSFLSKINPFAVNLLPTPTPTPPQLSKEYIYAGSRVLAVEDANTTAPAPSDLAVWRPSSGQWYVMGGAGGSQQVTQNWGTSGDLPVPADYDGDGKTDFCIFRSSTNKWWLLRSSNGTYDELGFGANGDVPAPADYDGDGKTDLAMFRPSTGVWYILQSSNSSLITPSLGTGGGFTPTPADYDGDGKADVSVWYNLNATFYTIKSANNPSQSYTAVQYGQTNDVPVVADYDGDGKADFALRRGADWVFLYSANNQTQTINWQQSGDKAVQNDYDGDGKVDIAVWRESNGNWYIRNSSTGQLRQVAWGTTGDIPVPANYRR